MILHCTLAVAKLENCESKYKQFQDIINLNEENFFYFSALWRGDPPMGPINSGYVQDVLKLKTRIISIIKQQKMFCTFENFERRFTSLWNAVLRENHVFNFKNAIEISAYSELDFQHGQLRNELHSLLDKLLLSCNHKLGSCKIKEVDAVQNTCIENCAKKINDKFEELVATLKKFIKDHVHSTLLSKWEFRTLDKLLFTKQECIEIIRKECKKAISLKLNEIEKRKVETKFEQELHLEIVELADMLKHQGELQDKNIKIKFKEEWKKWIENLRGKLNYIPYPSEKEIDRAIEDTLVESFSVDRMKLFEKLNDRSIKEWGFQKSFKLDDDLHINILLPQATFENIRYKASTEEITSHTSISSYIYEELESTINDQIKLYELNASEMIMDKLKQTRTFDRWMIQRVLNELFSSIDAFNKSSEKFQFTSTFKMDFSWYICNIAAEKIKVWSKDSKTSNDPILSLLEKRNKFYTKFKDRCKQVATEIAAANQLCNSLFIEIKNSVSKRLHITVVKDLTDTHELLKSKRGYKVKVLCDLANFNQFRLYKEYLSDTLTSFQCWAHYYVEKHCTVRSGISEVISEKFQQLAYKEIHSSIEMVCTAAQMSGHCNVLEWLDQFCATIDDHLQINREVWTKDIIGVNKNIHVFINHLVKELQDKSNIEFIYCGVKADFNEIHKKASKSLYRNLIENTCNEQCPFCKETCEVLMKDHLDDNQLHCAKAHRPQCLGMITWTKSKQLVLDVCSNLVASRNRMTIDGDYRSKMPARQYKKIYPEWDIASDRKTESPIYWMWFIQEFHEDIEKWMEAIPTGIPDTWKKINITKEKAIQSLYKMYDVHEHKIVDDTNSVSLTNVSFDTDDEREDDT